ncbi:MAG: hypothetical protein JRD49_03795 [Deltaproteobacteria bacterium]|nr:hypothetical protein [Deltaproteobacteria bacterium]MBW2611550.1 hypothetical protein [Deltaproteobacteria bacterium]MBW2633898.1 hypothetical protein [Deltaproteobacteria bacterium]MBW2676669.1 hypothetical protein [Deltaproteobacteria bacterium]
MKIVTNRTIQSLLMAIWFLLMAFQVAEARVKKEGGKIFIVDQTGERWDITQAATLGFDPYKFEFGIGRYAFDPLDETDWHSGEDRHPSNLRIIGVVDDDDAHAYSVKRLRHHETANTFLGSKPIVAGY